MPEGAGAPVARRRRWLRWLVGAGAAACAFVVGANLYLIAASRAAIVTGVEAAAPRPYTIVLGNRVYADGTPASDLAARLETALALHRAGRAGKIIVSGMARGAYDEPGGMAAWLEARGVPAADIILDRGGHRTAATMADAAALGVRSASVVSQGYHLPRALYLARHAGIDASGVPADPGDRGGLNGLKVFLRERVARAEALLEVAVRGVR